ncbi:MAG: hypothetical protein WCG87_02480 [Bacteroidota bacterium]
MKKLTFIVSTFLVMNLAAIAQNVKHPTDPVAPNPKPATAKTGGITKPPTDKVVKTSANTTKGIKMSSNATKLNGAAIRGTDEVKKTKANPHVKPQTK